MKLLKSSLAVCWEDCAFAIITIVTAHWYFHRLDITFFVGTITLFRIAYRHNIKFYDTAPKKVSDAEKMTHRLPASHALTMLTAASLAILSFTGCMITSTLSPITHESLLLKRVLFGTVAAPITVLVVWHYHSYSRSIKG